MPGETRRREAKANYNGNSEVAIQHITTEMKNRKELEMQIKIHSGVARLRRIITKRSTDEYAERWAIREELEASRKKLVALIERYADLAVSVRMKERYLAAREELLDIEQNKSEIHSQINDIATELGISESEARSLMEMRIQDRLAESETGDITRSAQEAAKVPLTAYDDDLVYMYQYEQDGYRWRLLEPEEQLNTYSLVYCYVFRPHDKSFFETGKMVRPSSLPGGIAKEEGKNHEVVRRLFADVEARNIEGVKVSFSCSHYCHDPEYPSEDYMAYQLMRQTLTFPKNSTAKVLKALQKAAGKE
jgi:hypothetical protein